MLQSQNLQCHSRPPKMTVPLTLSEQLPCLSRLHRAACCTTTAKAAKLDGVMPQALRVTRHSLVDTQGVWPETRQFGQPCATTCSSCGRKSVYAAAAFPVPRHVRSGMVDSFFDRSFMFIMQLPKRSKCLHFAHVTSQLQQLYS